MITFTEDLPFWEPITEEYKAYFRDEFIHFPGNIDIYFSANDLDSEDEPTMVCLDVEIPDIPKLSCSFEFTIDFLNENFRPIGMRLRQVVMLRLWELTIEERQKAEERLKLLRAFEYVMRRHL